MKYVNQTKPQFYLIQEKDMTQLSGYTLPYWFDCMVLGPNPCSTAGSKNVDRFNKYEKGDIRGKAWVKKICQQMH